MSTQTAPVVTDGEKLTCAERTHELFTRFKKNVYTNPKQVLDGLQRLIEGREIETTPTVIKNIGKTKTFFIWKTITIGGVVDLIGKVADAVSLGYWARRIMGKMSVSKTEENVNLIVLTPTDLGYTENPTTTELLDPKKLAKWSAENLDGYVVELCLAEVGPHLRIQYMDQPKGEVLWIAMERIAGSDGRPRMFTVGRRDDGRLWLSTYWRNPDDWWVLDSRIVFRLRKIKN